ncbi:MAG: multidrug efflux RND transporter permease subunit [Gammaproteobacteria bacterium]|nr:multidrug efflux RND transporter permease subunit [Gammaproteobacteria bacterium]
MRFTDIFIRRPVLAASISLLILLLGFNALKDMQVREYPEVTNTVVSVTTSYYGASADLIQGFITQPIEQAVAQADNVDFITSSSAAGLSTVTVTMKLNTDPNAALANILAKVNSVRSQLPSEAEDPTVDISTGGGTSVIYIAFSSDELNTSQLNDYLERVVRPQLFTIGGVAKVNLFGGVKFALRVWLDPARMAAFDLTAAEVVQALTANNVQAAPGQTIGTFTVFNTTADTQVGTTAELERMVIKSESDGSVVRVGDIARVSLEKSRDTYRALANGQNAVVVGLDAAPTANPLNITHDVRLMLPDLQKQLPSTMKMMVLYDSTIAIEESISEVVKTIAEAAAIVLVVIILFLGNLRAVVIPIITIPLSLVGVAMLMQFFGFSINLMTLLAMVLAIGLVVDDAIVVVENVDRHIKQGKTPFQAALVGTREIAGPVIAMTITLGAVYAPIALMGGLTGSLFKEFALTLAGAVFVSGVVALTLSPMMCAKMLRAHSNPSRFETLVEHTLERVNRGYERALGAVMQQRAVVIIFALIIFGSLPLLLKLIPSELAPSEDKGAFMVMAKAPNTANLDFIEQQMKLGDRELQFDERAAWLSFSGVPQSNMGMGILVLKSWGERDRTQAEVLAEAAHKASEIPGVKFSAFAFPELPGASSGLPIQFVITTPNSFESLFEVANAVHDKIKASGKFVYTDMDLTFDAAGLKIHIDRDKAGAYGITMQQIAQTLGVLMSDGYVNRIDLGGRSYEVIPQVERSLRLNPESLNQYYVRAADGRAVPLGNLLSLEVQAEPRYLPHYNQLNSVTISGLAPALSMGDAVALLEGIAADVLPKGYQYDFLGESRQFVTEGSALFATFGLAIAIIFLVLASQFESVRDPLVILVSVPLAVCGALVALAWGLATMNIYSQVGLVTLIGLITKHGILICEVAKEEQLNHGKDRIAAVTEAARVRLRPILMTTAAMVAGLIPLLLAEGAGAVSRFSIGIVIVAGLTIGTLFTLFVLPVIYSFLASRHEHLPEVDEGEAISPQIAK